MITFIMERFKIISPWRNEQLLCFYVVVVVVVISIAPNNEVVFVTRTFTISASI